MSPNLKKFIEKYIELINSENYSEVYKVLEASGLGEPNNSLTNVLLDIDIPITDILNKLQSIPASFAAGCNQFNELLIPDNIKSIGRTAFWQCKKLEKVQIDKQCEYISDSCFRKCSSLQSIDIGNITDIPTDTFEDCVSLTTINNSKNIESIGFRAFEGCINLKMIELGENLRHVDEKAFTKCGSNLVIKYNGSKADWKLICDPHAFDGTYYQIICSDGIFKRSPKKS